VGFPQVFSVGMGIEILSLAAADAGVRKMRIGNGATTHPPGDKKPGNGESWGTILLCFVS